MGLSVTDSRAQRFWATDIDKLEESFLNGVQVTSLPTRRADGRTPNQGSVLTRCVDIDHVVSKPNWFAVAREKLKFAITGNL